MPLDASKYRQCSCEKSKWISIIYSKISGEFHEEVDFDERIRRLQNDFGVDVFFTWGIIEQEGKNSMALVAGGWNDALLVEEGNYSKHKKSIL